MYTQIKLFIASIVAVLLVAISPPVQAWGERGHDLITRVAVQHMRGLSDDNANLMRPFLLRDHMLGHLSNTPDIVWRADYMSEEARSANSPTHYINLEKVITGVKKWDDFPRDFREYHALCKSKGRDTSDVGTAPWRVLQLYKLIVEELTNLDSKPDDLKIDHVNKALTYAGLMAHFVGDLANPHHTSANYDGQLTGNKGLHAYFESMVVAELSFSLSRKMLRKAKRKRLWLQDYSVVERKDILADPQKLVWALVADSHTKVDRLHALDNRHSIIVSSPIDSDNRKPAERKSAKESAKKYEKFAVQRMAVGADALAKLWILAWQDAASPDMSEYRSNYYPVQPPFITPSYIVEN